MMRAMYRCTYCERQFVNVLWKTAEQRPVCINCAVLEKKSAVFSPDDREVPKEPEAKAVPGATEGGKS